jgi:bla regulator protein BlaR1
MIIYTRYFFTILSIFFFGDLNAQKKTKSTSIKKTQTIELSSVDEDIEINFTEIDDPPVFPNCENNLEKKECFLNELQKHIKENFKYPEITLDSVVQGKVFVNFLVRKDGSVVVNYVKGPDPLLENEAKRILELLPKFSPAIHNGKAVVMKMAYPITFKLKANDEVVESIDSKKDIPIQMDKIDTPPIYVGCENEKDLRLCFQEKIQKHIAKNFRYPNEALNKRIQGKVFVYFVLEKDGTISIASLRGPHPILEKESKRIIELIPKMTPAKTNNEPVRVTMSIPITFKLEEERTQNYNPIFQRRN